MRGYGRALSLAVLALLLLSTVPAQTVTAQTGYSQKLQVYIAGSDALWYMTFSGINASSKLSSFESAPGLQWYNITAVDTSTWQTGFQVFGPDGYNLIPVPFVPSQGAFLTVGSDSFADASAAASALDSYLLTSFVSLSNSTSSSGGTYTFYSPLTFSAVVPKTLLDSLPVADGGFTSALNASSFASSASPIVVLSGEKSPSGFDTSLTLGSISTTALGSKGAPDLLSYFGTTISSIDAGNKSTSSTIQINVLDGLISSKDTAAVVTNDTSAFSSSYTLTLKRNSEVFAINATVMQQPAGLLAYRSIYPGVLSYGQNMSVTVTMTDLSSTTAIKISNFTDDWWQAPEYEGLFKLVSNITSVFPTSISASSTETPVYVLEYVGSATERIVIPPSVISYTFTKNGATFEGQTRLNPVPVLLGESGVDVVTYEKFLSSSSNAEVGTNVTMSITAVNEGNLPAASVTVAGKPVPGLAANGGSATVNATVAASSFLGFIQSAEYSTKYVNPTDPSVVYNSTTNALRVYFSHGSMAVGFPALTVDEYVAPSVGGGTKLVVTYTTSNEGAANVTSFTATGALPEGLGCGTVGGKGITCSSGTVELDYANLEKNTSETATLTYNVTKPQNFIIAPMSFSGRSAGTLETGSSNAMSVPTGLQTTKRFDAADVFQGMTSGVNITVSNAGPFTVYNATIASTADSFDKLVTGSVSSKSYVTLTPGTEENFSYTISVTSGSGSIAPSNATSEFYFGGVLFEIQSPTPTEQVFKPLAASVSTTPVSPTEGKPFKIAITITNPASVSVSDVTFTLSLGKGSTLSALDGLTASSGTLTVYNATLSPHGVLSASVEVVAGSGTSVDFSAASLTFSYGGQKLTGTLPSGSVAVGVDVTTRYLVPIALVFLAMLATTYYVRRKAVPSGQTSQK